eukprot:CAMPEP_0117015280 /NCGR_PEP_ID=MMETSP0472-20121206/12241_1 /TAXON_ID=693140 ORGANISM="Tiarina fusus, Strain LIS" /NCGR_SAMPLE_ID=MMETSP0472 /ASSEMBLY_ACC=CAM_ASM_000603 /LENGTH=115 /DNA_ID=CAMNT_0004719053 /DNA_START=1048 /DNA_END=1392 /DNA_ORIENTATION=+
MIQDLHNLVLLDVTGNESIYSPPLDVCQGGVKAVIEYLKNVPVTVDDLEEGWEFVEPTQEDIKLEFGLSSNDLAPYLANYSSDLSTPQIPDDDEQIENPAPDGWISWLSRSILGG